MKGLTRISKDSGMQTFLKITFFLCAAGSCSLIPPHHKRRKSSLCFLLPALPPPLHSMSSLPLEFQKSILVFRAQTTLNKGKQYRLMSPENRNIYTANFTCLARAPISLQQLVLMQVHNIYQLARMSIAFTLYKLLIY